MVILIHQNPVFIEQPTSFGGTLYNILCSAGSHVVSGIAVPMFFLISGYFYFYKTQKWDMSVYAAKTKKRFRTLVIPYICWNLMAFLLSPVLLLASGELREAWTYLRGFSWHVFWDATSWGKVGTTFFGMINTPLHTGPQDLPLWFLRNLIIIVTLTPIWHYFLKRWGMATVLLLGGACMTGAWVPYPPFAINGIFYFCLGGYMSIHQQCMIDCFGKIRRLVYVATPCLAMLRIYCDICGQKMMFVNFFFVLCAIICAYYLMYKLVRSGKCHRQWSLLAQSSFFVYASHTVYINGKVMYHAHKWSAILFSFSPSLAATIGYVVSPLIVATICVLIYACLKKFTPKLLGVLTGDR